MPIGDWSKATELHRVSADGMSLTNNFFSFGATTYIILASNQNVLMIKNYMLCEKEIPRLSIHDAY